MKAFIWTSISGLTENWHSGGGLLVIAENLGEARVSLLNYAGVRKSGDEPCEAFTKEPDKVLELAGAVERDVLIFPDAGCC